MLETARVQAVMWDGGSEDQLFYGAAGAVLGTMVRVLPRWRAIERE